MEDGLDRAEVRAGRDRLAELVAVEIVGDARAGEVLRTSVPSVRSSTTMMSSRPRAFSALTRFEPMKPAPPVTMSIGAISMPRRRGRKATARAYRSPALIAASAAGARAELGLAEAR